MQKELFMIRYQENVLNVIASFDVEDLLKTNGILVDFDTVFLPDSMPSVLFVDTRRMPDDIDIIVTDVEELGKVEFEEELVGMLCHFANKGVIPRGFCLLDLSMVGVEKEDIADAKLREEEFNYEGKE